MGIKNELTEQLLRLGKELEELGAGIPPIGSPIDDDGIRALYTDLDERELRNTVVAMHKMVVGAFVESLEDEGVPIPEFLRPELINRLSAQCAEMAIAEAREGGLSSGDHEA